MTAKKKPAAQTAETEQITPIHQWTNDGDEVLMLRFVAADGLSYSGVDKRGEKVEFRWPLEVGATVEAPDWTDDAQCGGGLHGWPWGSGIGSGKDPDWHATWKMDMEDTERQIKQLQDRLEEERAAHTVAEQAEISYATRLEEGRLHLAEMERTRVDTTALAARMTEVESVNRKVRDNIDRALAYQKTDEFDAAYRSLTEVIATIDEEKRRSLAEVQWPVEGLGFPEDGSVVLYNDFPLAQAAGAEKLRVAVSLAMLMSGGMRLAFVDEGERLDLTQLALLDSTVRELGGQVIMSRVSDGPECALIISDGAASAPSTKSTKTNGKDKAAA